MSCSQKIRPDEQVESWDEIPTDCSCWYDKRGRLILWAWRCAAHPGADY